MKVHDDELDIDDELVRALIDEQFPQWASLPLVRAGDGTVHVIYRLGQDLSVRLPRREGPKTEADLEHTWLPILAPQLPVEIPSAVARGRPGEGYPWFWSVHTWLDGDLPTGAVPCEELAALVAALQAIDTNGAPEPAGGRGRPLAERDRWVRDALGRVDAPGAVELWDRALGAPEWEHARVWVHADLDGRNIVVRDGHLAGVFDWGGMGLADPAVDVQVAWKLVAREERDRFRALLDVDDATWLRAQGWAVSQALIALGYYTPKTNPPIHAEATRWLADALDG